MSRYLKSLFAIVIGTGAFVVVPHVLADSSPTCGNLTCTSTGFSIDVTNNTGMSHQYAYQASKSSCSGQGVLGESGSNITTRFTKSWPAMCLGESGSNVTVQVMEGATGATCSQTCTVP